MPHKGTPSPELIERNRKIYDEFKNGKSKAQLSREYELAYTRIREIIMREQSKEDKK